MIMKMREIMESYESDIYRINQFVEDYVVLEFDNEIDEYAKLIFFMGVYNRSVK